MEPENIEENIGTEEPKIIESDDSKEQDIEPEVLTTDESATPRETYRNQDGAVVENDYKLQ